MKVSVVIPAYNDKGTIAGAVESALTQHFDGRFEVIVVNDGSTDGTRAELEKFGGRIRVIEQDNAGVSMARNAGMAAAAGEYIALLDADDTWTADKLAKTVSVLEHNPACAAVFSNAMEVDDAGREISYYVGPEFAHSPTLEEMLEHTWPALPSATVVRRATMQAVGGFPKEFKAEHWGGEDVFTLLLLRERGELAYVPEALARYRVRELHAHYASRMQGRRLETDSAKAFDDFARRFDSGHVFARLMREHFGARGRKLTALGYDRIGQELVTVGMMAMHEGRPAFARRCYLESLRYSPMMLKTYLRLAWAMLPATVSKRISPLLAPGLRQSLSGPPFTATQGRL
ncbi:MAG: glycosyltransferase family A protein [Candidatus Binatus sp.]